MNTHSVHPLENRFLGPVPIPILGNLLSLYPAETMHETFQKWGKKYGPLYTIWFGEIPVVTMADYETISETFQKDGDTYAGRMFSPSLTELMRGECRIYAEKLILGPRSLLLIGIFDQKSNFLGFHYN